ncbi:hypothetical protein HPB48_007919 [Haemaphysalis longicornis]|uniref:Uncharacterized protein n=1 Tax=Haemaphysalis longicornis TaxID=44386 RepID=A0A9J6GTL9_HAELO|nr:hypothetical protein HPB48_007919 [Haemaphysalis longicornis]
MRQIALTCNFGTSLDRMLRDRFVCVLQSAGVRRQPLAKPQLTKGEAGEIALSAEMKEANAQEIESPAAKGTVDSLGGQSYRPKTEKRLRATSAAQNGTDPRIAASDRHHALSANNEVISPEPVFAVRVVLGLCHQCAKYTPCRRGRKTWAPTSLRWRQ